MTRAAVAAQISVDRSDEGQDRSLWQSKVLKSER